MSLLLGVLTPPVPIDTGWLSSAIDIIRGRLPTFIGTQLVSPTDVGSLAWNEQGTDVIRKVPPVEEGLFNLKIRQEEVGRISWIQSPDIFTIKRVLEGANGNRIEASAPVADIYPLISFTDSFVKPFKQQTNTLTTVIRQEDVGFINWFTLSSDVIRRTPQTAVGYYDNRIRQEDVGFINWFVPPADVIRKIPLATIGYYDNRIRLEDVGFINWYNQRVDIIRRKLLPIEQYQFKTPTDIGTTSWYLQNSDIIRKKLITNTYFDERIRQEDVGFINWYLQGADVVRKVPQAATGHYQLKTQTDIGVVSWLSLQSNDVFRKSFPNIGYFDNRIRLEDVGRIPWFVLPTDVIRRIPLASIGHFDNRIRLQDVGFINWFATTNLPIWKKLNTNSIEGQFITGSRITPGILSFNNILVDKSYSKYLYYNNLLITDTTPNIETNISIPIFNNYYTFTLSNLVLPIITGYTYSKRVAIHIPDEAPIGVPVRVSLELIVGTPVAYDSLPDIRIYHLDDLGNQITDLPLSPCIQYGSNPAYYIDWTPTAPGTYMIETTGIYLAQPVEDSRAVSIRPKFDPIALALHDIFVNRM